MLSSIKLLGYKLLKKKGKRNVHKYDVEFNYIFNREVSVTLNEKSRDTDDRPVRTSRSFFDLDAEQKQMQEWDEEQEKLRQVGRRGNYIFSVLLQLVG